MQWKLASKRLANLARVPSPSVADTLSYLICKKSTVQHLSWTSDHLLQKMWIWCVRVG